MCGICGVIPVPICALGTVCDINMIQALQVSIASLTGSGAVALGWLKTWKDKNEKE